MRGKRKIAGQNWEFDSHAITVRIAMTWKRRGGRKVIIAPDGSDAWAPTKPRRELRRRLGGLRRRKWPGLDRTRGAAVWRRRVDQ